MVLYLFLVHAEWEGFFRTPLNESCNEVNLFILRKRFREFLTVYAIHDFERTDLADGTEACAPF